MRLGNVWGCLALAGAMLCTVVVSAQDEPETKGKEPEKTLARKVTTKPATRPSKDAKEEGPKLLVPVNKIKTLTDEQLKKLTEIAAQAEKDKEAIMEKAREASFALLTEEQKAELGAYKQKAQAAAAARKEQAAKRREERQKAQAEKAKLKGQKKGKETPAAGTGKP